MTLSNIPTTLKNLLTKIKNHFFKLSALILSVFFIFHIATTEKLPLVEDTFDKFYDHYKNMGYYSFKFIGNGDLMYEFGEDRLKFYTFDLQRNGDIPLPFKGRDVFSCFTYKDDFIFVITGSTEDFLLRKYYRIDLKKKTVSTIDTKTNYIYAVDSFYSDPNKLYVKYLAVNNEKNILQKYYGTINPITGECTPIVAINDDNKNDVYIKEQLVFKLNLGKADISIRNDANQELFHFPRGLYTHEELEFKRFQKHFSYFIQDSETVIYLNPNQGKFGTLYSYHIKNKKTSKIPIVLKSHLTHVFKLEQKGLLLEYSQDGFCEVYDPQKANESVSNFIKKHSNISILQMSNDYTKIYYNTVLPSGGAEFFLEDLTTNTRSSIQEFKHVANWIKKSTVIQDKKGMDLQFYTMEHTDSKPRPVAILLHGGPFSRFDLTNFNEAHLLLYDLGFNVIELNFHGSTGLGLDYTKAAGNNIAQATIDNVESVLDWLKTKPNMKTDQVVLSGASYGGYATMLCKMALKDRITVAVAQMPGSLDDFKKYDFEVFKGMNKGPKSYDNWTLAKTTDQKIGIIYNPYDAQLTAAKDWLQIERQNKNIEILKLVNTGHNPQLKDYKAVVYYIHRFIPLEPIQ